jgi:hypothetical protein
LRKESITIDEEKDKQSEAKKEDMSRRLAISASTPARTKESESPINHGATDISDSQMKSQKKRRGAKVDFKSPDAESPNVKKADKRGGKQAAGEEKGTDTESNSTTPRLPQRKHNKAPHSRLQMENSQNKPQFQGGNVPQWVQHVPPSGVDAALYAPYFAHFSPGFTLNTQNVSQNPTPHFPPATQAYSGYGSPAFGFPQRKFSHSRSSRSLGMLIN